MSRTQWHKRFRHQESNTHTQLILFSVQDYHHLRSSFAPMSYLCSSALKPSGYRVSAQTNVNNHQTLSQRLCLPFPVGLLGLSRLPARPMFISSQNGICTHHDSRLSRQNTLYEIELMICPVPPLQHRCTLCKMPGKQTLESDSWNSVLTNLLEDTRLDSAPCHVLAHPHSSSHEGTPAQFTLTLAMLSWNTNPNDSNLKAATSSDSLLICLQKSNHDLALLASLWNKTLSSPLPSQAHVSPHKCKVAREQHLQFTSDWHTSRLAA